MNMKTLTMFLFVLLISCAVIAQETGKGAVVAARERF